MNKLFVIASLCFVIAGCAFTKQAVEDYQEGKNTPLINGEIAPKDQAAPIVETASVLPIVGPFAGILGIVLTGFFTWQRGRAIRKNDGNVTPQIVSNHNVFTGLLQDIANIAAGIFSTKSGSDQTSASTVIQRVWKVALATLASGATLAIANPSLQTYLGAHPVLSSLFVAVTSGIAGVEKALSNVPPVVTVNPNTTGSGTTTVTTV